MEDGNRNNQKRATSCSNSKRTGKPTDHLIQVVLQMLFIHFQTNIKKITKSCQTEIPIHSFSNQYHIRGLDAPSDSVNKRERKKVCRKEGSVGNFSSLTRA